MVRWGEKSYVKHKRKERGEKRNKTKNSTHDGGDGGGRGRSSCARGKDASVDICIFSLPAPPPIFLISYVPHGPSIPSSPLFFLQVAPESKHSLLPSLSRLSFSGCVDCVRLAGFCLLPLPSYEIRASVYPYSARLREDPFPSITS